MPDSRILQILRKGGNVEFKVDGSIETRRRAASSCRGRRV
jgi:hypothetical protein